MTYQIYGDYGFSGEALLEEFEDLNAAVEWVEGYTDDGDMGGYERIEIVTFNGDGELVVHYSLNAEDLEGDWDGQPDEAQEWADFDPDC